MATNSSQPRTIVKLPRAAFEEIRNQLEAGGMHSWISETSFGPMIFGIPGVALAPVAEPAYPQVETGTEIKFLDEGGTERAGRVTGKEFFFEVAGFRGLVVHCAQDGEEVPYHGILLVEGEFRQRPAAELEAASGAAI